MAERVLRVVMVSDERDLERGYRRASVGAKNLDRDLGKLTRGAISGSGAFRGLGRTLAFASGAFLGAAGIAATIRGAFDELNQSRTVTAQTNAVLRSTGAVAGVTADHVDRLGQSLLRKTGIDDEAIRSTENLLLTFTNIRNVVGDNNDIFDQATKATLDMATAMGEDFPSAAVRIGKALQDPIKGATALRRVGVLFTEEQQEQIKTLVQTGNVLGAQRIVLAELTREFGRSAEAAGRVQPWNLLRETIRNLSAELVSRFLPRIIEVTDRIQHWLDNPANIEAVQRGFENVADAIGRITGRVRDVVAALGGWKNAIAIIIGAWAGFKAAGVGAAVAVQFANIAAAAGTAAAWRAALISTGFGALAVAAGIAAALIITHWGRVKVFFERFWIELKAGAVRGALGVVEPFSHLPSRLGAWARTAKERLLAEMQGLRTDFANLGKEHGDAYGAALANAMRLQGRKTLGAGPGMTLPGSTVGAAPPGGGTVAGVVPSVSANERVGRRNTIFDALIGRREDRVQDIQSLRSQASALAGIARAISAEIGRVHDKTRKLTLGDDLASVLRQRRGVLQQISDAAKQAATDAAANALKVRDALQFRALGLGPTGEGRVPGLTALRKELERLTRGLDGTILDNKRTSSLISRLRKVLSGGLGALSEDVRKKVAEMLSNLDRQLQEHATKTRDTRRHFSTNAVLANLGLSPEQIRSLRFRLAQIGPGGTVPTRRTGAFALAGGQTYVLHNPQFHGVQDVAAFEEQLRKRSLQRARARRGPYAGRN